MLNWEKSLRDSEKAIRLDNGYAKAYWRKGNALMELKKTEAAVEAYAMAAKLKPDQPQYAQLHQNAEKKMFAGMNMGERYKKEGNELYKKGSTEEAIEKYTKALQHTDVKDEESKALRASILANRAACRRQLYHHKKCVEDCTEALSLYPTHVKALIRRGQSYEALEKWQEALNDYDKVNVLAPGTKVSIEGSVRVRGAIRRFAKQGQ